MQINTGMKVLAGSIALALSGGAIANTSTTVGSTGTLMVIIDDTTTGNMFMYDTAQPVGSFSGGASQSPITLNDANFSAFTATVGSTDTLEYTVIGAQQTGSGATAQETLLFTSPAAPPGPPPAPTTGSNITSAISFISVWLSQANSYTSATTNSVFTQASVNPNAGYFGSATEGGVQGEIGVTDSGTPGGAALYFWNESCVPTACKTSSSTKDGTVSALAGTWTLGAIAPNATSDTIQYSTSAVPLPAPLLLLLSGLGMMGVVGRRQKAT